MKEQDLTRSGVLPDHMIKALFESNHIQSRQPLLENQIQPASMDLRLGERAWRVRASFLPGPTQSVEQALTPLTLHQINLEDGYVLETGCVYIVEVQEQFFMPDQLRAFANPKSSTGRIDLFTRLITDQATSFDTISRGYKGKLYLELSPRSFPILVRSGSRLGQIRFCTEKNWLGDDEIETVHNKERLSDANRLELSHGLAVHIDLQGFGEGHIMGYRAKRHTGVIDVDKTGLLQVEEYWDVLSGARGQMVLDPDEFYILASQEALHVPPGLAAEMVAIDPLVGEFRVHYAGFFDPGFGHQHGGFLGARAVLEVRSHEVPFVLVHGQQVARLKYERMLEKPSRLYGEGLASNYQAQSLKLSKHFLSQ